jgi:hypothetical protein
MSRPSRPGVETGARNDALGRRPYPSSWRPQRDGWDYRNAEWQIATAIKSVKLAKVDKR